MPETFDEVNCFISYHRPDNRDFLEVVDRLKAELAGRFEASTGRSLNIFLDRDSIGWGEDWRERIHSSVLSATFFIPIVTMRFFRSDACREELTTYHENARQLGVTELILPVVLAGSSEITATSDNADIRLIERLNYISIESQWEAGYESPEWRSVVGRMVKDLTAALAKAETAIAGRESEREGLPEVEVAQGTAADLSELTESVLSTTSDMERSLSDMTTLGTVITTATEGIPPHISEVQRQGFLTKASKDISVASNRLAESAAQFERGATATDTQLRAVIRELRNIDNPAAKEQLSILERPLKEFPDLGPHLLSIDEALNGLRMASMSNVTMRKALQPAIRAMQSMRIAMSVANGWKSL